MRESCSCGAEIRTIHYRRVLDWRNHHQHDTAPEERETYGGADTVPVGFAREYEYQQGERTFPVVNA